MHFRTRNGKHDFYRLFSYLDLMITTAKPWDRGGNVHRTRGKADRSGDECGRNQIHTRKRLKRWQLTPPTFYWSRHLWTGKVKEFVYLGSRMTNHPEAQLSWKSYVIDRNYAEEDTDKSSCHLWAWNVNKAGREPIFSNGKCCGQFSAVFRYWT